MATAVKKSLDRPDQRVEMEGIVADVVQMGDASIARSVFQPGAHCSIGGTSPSGVEKHHCVAHHAGVVLSGRLHIEMDDGAVMDVGPDEVFDIPPGHDGWVVGDQPMVNINWSGFRSWLPAESTGQRVVLTLVFTDIVGSTETAERMGDASWRELLAQHNRAVRVNLDRFRGREVTTTGDGFLAVFDGAARALQAARAISDAAAALGIAIRAGVHSGEVELVGDDVRGIAVHEAARIAAAAGPGEILVSAMTQALAVGSGLVFEPRGERDLKGLTGPRTLYALAGGA